MVRIMYERSCSQWFVFNGVKGQTSVIIQSDPSISVKRSMLLGQVAVTMVCVDLNQHHIRDLAPVSREKKPCTSQQTRNTIVELVHRHLIEHFFDFIS